MNPADNLTFLVIWKKTTTLTFWLSHVKLWDSNSRTGGGGGVRLE